MQIILTGVAGFIGFHVAIALLRRGDRVLGIDNLNAYYDVSLKQARLSRLRSLGGFSFTLADCADPAQIEPAFDATTDLVVHLAAQAGVRYSLQNPLQYIESNVRGHTVMLDAAARKVVPVVYASSSSVYGSNVSVPFGEHDRVDNPVSLYAATKRSGELLAEAYRQTHGLRSTGLRFFTVYGPYGRPDMAPWLFTDAILNGRPIKVFNNGDMQRDFTHVGDVVKGVIAAIDRAADKNSTLEPIYNIGNSKPVELMDFIAAIEAAAGRKAVIEFLPKPPGDVTRTFADITLASRDFGYSPVMDIQTGMAEFVAWFAGWATEGAEWPED